MSTLTVVAAAGSGVMAGVFFAFSVMVMRGLGGIPAAPAVTAMQVINAAALTPLFLAAFVGTGLASVALGVAAVLDLEAPLAPYALAGAALYLAGSLVLTIAYHVPRNDALAGVDPHGPEAAGHWARYRRGWTAWNHVRAAACLAATVVLAAGLHAA